MTNISSNRNVLMAQFRAKYYASGRHLGQIVAMCSEHLLNFMKLCKTMKLPKKTLISL